MFLTLEDPRAKVQGSRDPLGVQVIWSSFGRQVVTNLTTVSRSIRGFTVVLLARYYGERLIQDGRIGEDEAVAAFLRMEQVAAYARHFRHKQPDILGITRVRRFLSEHGSKVPIQNDSSGLILSDQKTYGLWGLYSVSARISGLLEEGPVGLTELGRDFVTSQYARRLRPAEGKLLRLLAKGGTLDTRKGQLPIDPVASVLSNELSDAEVAFYGSTLRDAEHVQQPLARHRQAALVPLLRTHTEPGEDVTREEIARLAKAAEEGDESLLADKLARILRVEALLAPAEALLNLVLARNGQRPANIAAHIRDHWGSRLAHLEDPIEPLMSEIRSTTGEDHAAALHRCDQALGSGDYVEAIEAILDCNRIVMEDRGAAPWVKLSGGKLDVRYRSRERVLPSGDQVPGLWYNSYFIDTLKDVTFQLEGHSK